MKAKAPEFLKNVTPKMFFIWAVSFVCLVALGLGIPAIVLGTTPETYGMDIKFSNVVHIEYRNQHQQPNVISPEIDPLFEDATRAILRRLREGGETNRLANMFRGNPEQRVERNNTDTGFTSTFHSMYARNALVIWFRTPDQGIRTVSAGSSYKLFNIRAGATLTSAENEIHGLMIPLDNRNNRFQQQVWYPITRDPNNQSSGASMSLDNKIVTYGNYHRLWSFISDLFML